MLTRITALPRDDRWTALARIALRYDLYARARRAHRNVLTSRADGRPSDASRRGRTQRRGRHAGPRTLEEISPPTPSTWPPFRSRCASSVRWSRPGPGLAGRRRAACRGAVQSRHVRYLALPFALAAGVVALINFAQVVLTRPIFRPESTHRTPLQIRHDSFATGIAVSGLTLGLAGVVAGATWLVGPAFVIIVIGYSIPFRRPRVASRCAIPPAVARTPRRASPASSRRTLRSA